MKKKRWNIYGIQIHRANRGWLAVISYSHETHRQETWEFDTFRFTPQTTCRVPVLGELLVLLEVYVVISAVAKQALATPGPFHN